MTELLRYAALGLGSGGFYALAGLGVVQIYRGSGVLNFSQGAMALVAATLFVRIWSDWGWPLWPCIALCVAVSAVLGLLVHLLVMRPLRDASQLVRIIATIGVLAVLQQGVFIVFGTQLTFSTPVRSFYPSGAWKPLAGVSVPYSNLVVVAVAVVLTAGLVALMRFTTFGLSTQAVAESRLATRALGRSPDLVAGANWALGAALAGVAGVLIVPLSGLANIAILLLVVPALAAALLGGFRSHWATLIGGIALACAQSILTNWTVKWDWPGGLPDALPFVLIVAVLVLRGSAIPPRDEQAARLPRVGRRLPSPIVVAPLLAVALVVCFTASDKLADTITTTALAATIGASLVVVTGLSGQISLAQYALAGFGAFVAARLSDIHGWPFEVVAPLGILAAVGVGLLFAVPSMRTRGPALAVATIGMGLAIEKVIFTSQQIIGGLSGTPVKRPTLFGWHINSIQHPQRYAAVSVVAFALLGVAVANLRAGRIGRRLLAVRSNERAAAALGVHVAGAKFYAFGLGAGIAAVAGVLMGFRFDTVQYSQFGFFASLQVVAFTLIGGVGYLAGAVIGALQVPSGVLAFLADDVGDLERWMLAGSGVLLIVTLIVFPDGIADLVSRAVGQWRKQPRSVAAVTASHGPRTKVAPRRLEVRDLVVRYGTSTAIDGVSLTVEPGHIVGLIGANGAGKTTLIDAVTGLIPAAAGSITLDGAELAHRKTTARARAGLGRCFQSLELFDDLTVEENLLVAREVLPRHAWVTDLVRHSRADLPADVRALVHELGLDDDVHRYPVELPHGRRRLVGVARALAAESSVLLLDEPAAGLDATETAELGALLTRAAREWGVGILLVEHDVRLVVDVSDEVVAIDFGRPIYSGPASGVLGDAAVRAAYLGLDAVSGPALEGAER